MAKTKKPTEELSWQCPVCGDIRYDRDYIPVPGYSDGDSSKLKIYQASSYFYCKGCTVHFSNPRLFNKIKK